MIAPVLAIGPVAAQQAGTENSEGEQKEKEEPVPGLAELIRHASQLRNRYTKLENNIAKLYDFSGFEEKLVELQNDISGLESDLEKLKNSESYSYDQLVELKKAIHIKRGSVDKMIEPIADAIQQIESRRDEWVKEGDRWNKWQASIQQKMSLNTIQSTFERSQEIISKAHGLILQQLEPLLDAEQRLEEIHVQAMTLLAGIDSMILALRGDTGQSSTPSMFSPLYYYRFDAGLLYDLQRNLRIMSWPQPEYFIQEWWVIALQILVILTIAFGIKRHRQLFEGDEQSIFLAKRPWSAGIFIDIAILHTLHGQLPQIWGLVLWALVAFAVVRLLEGYIEEAWKRGLFYALSGLLVISQLLFLLNLPVPILRLYIFVVSLGGCIIFFGYALKNARSGDSAVHTWIFRIGGLTMLMILAAEITGYSLFAQEVLDGSLKTIFFILIFWLLRQFVRIGLRMGFYSGPALKVPLLQKNAPVIVHRLTFLFNLILGAVIFASILVIWRVYQIPAGAIQGVFSFGFTLGSYKITTGLILTALAVLYGAYLISWAIQEILMEGVLKRQQVESGTRNSIAGFSSHFPCWDLR
jgi:small-conductance mechanosensitive channel